MKKILLLFSATLFTINVWGQSLNTPNGTIGSTTNPTTGNVGIGTTSPGAKLDIENNYGDGFLFDTEINTDQTKLIFKENNTDIFSFYYSGSASSPNNKFHIRDEYYGINIMSFVQQTGNVGIGTINPAFNLDIKSSSPALRLECDANNASGTIIRFTEHALQGAYLQYKGDVNRLDIGMHHANSYLTTDDNPAISILRSNNNVGIGTTSPTYLLSVKGTIGCGEVIVENVTGWADFVFEDDYNLMPLQELDSYIQKNKHLPEIPTTEEVKENGISVSKMNAKLLQKIEELTLYVIELSNENKEQKQVNVELKNEIEELKKLIK